MDADRSIDPVQWLDPREHRAWRGLQLLQIRLTAALTRQLATESCMSYQDYLVLVVLTDQPDGRMRVFELGRALEWEKSRVSHHIARMAERGLVRKEKCGTDRRGAEVVVTERGRSQIAAAAPGHVATVRRLFLDQVTPDQLDAIADAAESVVEALDRADMCDPPTSDPDAPPSGATG